MAVSDIYFNVVMHFDEGISISIIFNGTIAYI